MRSMLKSGCMSSDIVDNFEVSFIIDDPKPQRLSDALSVVF